MAGLESLRGQIKRLVACYEADRTDGPVPAWVLPPLSCEFLRDLARCFPSPPVAFEFGSGRSTHALKTVSARMASVEHSAEWLQRTEEENTEKRPHDLSAVIPLRRCWNRLRLVESFDLKTQPQMMESLRRSNLILVDSPPNPAKREHVLFTSLQQAPVGAVIVLDDLDVRAVTRFCLRLARQNKLRFEFWKVNIDHQLGVFLKMRDARIRSRPTMREFVGTWLRA